MMERDRISIQVFEELHLNFHRSDQNGMEIGSSPPPIWIEDCNALNISTD